MSNVSDKSICIQCVASTDEAPYVRIEQFVSTEIDANERKNERAAGVCVCVWGTQRDSRKSSVFFIFAAIFRYQFAIQSLQKFCFTKILPFTLSVRPTFSINFVFSLFVSRRCFFSLEKAVAISFFLTFVSVLCFFFAVCLRVPCTLCNVHCLFFRIQPFLFGASNFFGYMIYLWLMFDSYLSKQ